MNVLGVMAAAQAGAGSDGNWSGGWPAAMRLAVEWGPPVLVAALVVLLLRAASRGGRYRAVGQLDAGAQARVRAAIASAERATVGEIVPVVLSTAARHGLSQVWAALVVALVGAAVAAPVLPRGPAWIGPALGLALLGAGWICASRLPDFRRLFLSEARADRVVAAAALAAFERLGLARTQGRTGVLILVSLFERRAVVLGDAGIDEAMGPQRWTALTEELLRAAAEGRLADGLVAAVGHCGEVLAARFPWTAGDRNELPDRLEVS